MKSSFKRFDELLYCFQDRGLDFGLQVMPCSTPPGVKIFGSAPQFNAKNFSHIFVHGNDYEIPGKKMFPKFIPTSLLKQKTNF